MAMTPDEAQTEIARLREEIAAQRAALDEVASERAAARSEAEAARVLVERAQGELEAMRQELAAREMALEEARRAGLAALRRALLAEHAGAIVPELVTGATAEELEASVATARAAWERASEAARQQLASLQVPASNGARPEDTLAGLSPLDKIRLGLAGGRQG